jgi:hypothetical protein
LWLLLSPLFFLFTGCIEIVEDISIKRDKSGTITYSIETPGASGLLQGLAGMLNGSAEQNVRKEVGKVIRELEKQEGISNLRYNLDGRAGRYFLQFDFSHVSDFNNAMYALVGSKKNIFTPGYLKASSGRFKKINFSRWLNKYFEKENLEKPSRFITDNIAFRSVIHAPAVIKDVKPHTASSSRSPQSVEQKFVLTDILDGSVNTGMRIRY